MDHEEIRFDGQAIVVTGGGRGLGRAQALLLAARGARVVVADNGSAMDGDRPDQSPAEMVAADIRGRDGEAVACTADISAEAGARQAVEASLDAFGRIDGIAHNASTSPAMLPPDQTPNAVFDLVMRVNPYAGFWMARAAWPHMARQKHGRLLFVPSAALYGAAGNMPYASAKAAYIGMVRCLALEGAEHGIAANAIMPAGSTRMTERLQPSAYTEWLLRSMAPEKVATGAAFLLSSGCGVNGEIFAIGGGRIARVMIAEGKGVLDAGDSIEAVRDAMPGILSEEAFFYPKDLAERSIEVARLMGFGAGLDARNTFVDRD